jgi:sugar O-acyltransferase (sialic acid O-acetyltransferase NeuD family)
VRRALVIGGSGQGRQCIDVLRAAGEIQVVGVLDDGLELDTEVMGLTVMGGTQDLQQCADEGRADSFLVAIGDNHKRGSIFERALAACPHLEPVSAVHPRALVANDAVVGPGALVMAGAVVSNGCRLGAGVLLGTNASIDHDSTLAGFVSLAPGATTGGHVEVGEYTAIGLGALVIHEVTIGAHAVVGAGALVLEDLPGSVVAHGSPARVSRTRTKGEPYL